ncbi:hypothetical protein EKO27_g7431 [Xylaria grammica]|uniref:Protein kinase domain-containing protein n=1 Tax=Xylaria grammica TaxID=363999 RepID=A0A439CZM8_9PEZI|nr:hypothetical protein EKO27_g7431 [Xylaria grammica]
MASGNSDASPNWVRASWSNVSPGRFKLEKRLGTGARGTAWLFQDLKNGNVVRRFVVKYADSDIGVATIKREIQFLRQFQGHSHIAQVITENGALIGPGTHDPAAPEWQKTYVATEYLENISLETFLHRSRRRSNIGLNPTPSRVLWLIFRCLAKMVNAMANPTSGNRGFEGGNIQASLEQPGIFDLGTKYQIYHGDLDNLQNFIFGGYDSGEHSLVPTLKLIDFGEGTTDMSRMRANLPPPATADTITQGNIYDIGRVMRTMFEYFQTPTFRAFRALRPNIDEDLYNLASECAHVDHTKRPSAFQLLQRIEANISKKTGPESFPGKPFADWESDQRIREYMTEIRKS